MRDHDTSPARQVPPAGQRWYRHHYRAAAAFQLLHSFLSSRGPHRFLRDTLHRQRNVNHERSIFVNLLIPVPLDSWLRWLLLQVQAVFRRRQSQNCGQREERYERQEAVSRAGLSLENI